MESSPGQDEMNKVQIADLKEELSKAEDNLKVRNDELLATKKDLRLKDETIQQREIEISCLHGQVILHHEGEDSDTLTAIEPDPVEADDVLLDDLEWDPCDIVKTREIAEDK